MASLALRSQHSQSLLAPSLSEPLLLPVLEATAALVESAAALLPVLEAAAAVVSGVKGGLYADDPS